MLPALLLFIHILLFSASPPFCNCSITALVYGCGHFARRFISPVKILNVRVKCSAHSLPVWSIIQKIHYIDRIVAVRLHHPDLVLVLLHKRFEHRSAAQRIPQQFLIGVDKADKIPGGAKHFRIAVVKKSESVEVAGGVAVPVLAWKVN